MSRVGDSNGPVFVPDAAKANKPPEPEATGVPTNKVDVTQPKSDFTASDPARDWASFQGAAQAAAAPAPESLDVYAIMVCSPGWQKLANTQRDRLYALFTSKHPHAEHARKVLDTAIANGFQGSSPEDQAKTLAGLLTDELPFVTGGAMTENGQSTPYALHGPRVEKSFEFYPELKQEEVEVNGAKHTKPRTPPEIRDAHVYEVEVAGKRVTIYTPFRDPPNPDVAETKDGTHSVREIADAISRMPPAVRNQLNTLVLSPISNPEDARINRIMGGDPFTSYMHADTSGRVRVFPLAKRSSGLLRNFLMHELGHTVTMKRWGTDDPKRNDNPWNEWRDAMAKDVAKPSRYGKTHVLEDSAETVAIYQATIGTPAFEEYRRLYPVRFSLLDRLFAS